MSAPAAECSIVSSVVRSTPTWLDANAVGFERTTGTRQRRERREEAQIVDGRAPGEEVGGPLLDGKRARREHYARPVPRE
jgi:hypothetical protein